MLAALPYPRQETSYLTDLLFIYYMKTVYLILIGVLLAVIIWLFLRPVGETQPSKDDIHVINSLQKKVDEAKLNAFRVVFRANAEHQQHIAENKAKDEEIARLKRRSVKAKTVHVDTVIQQDKELGIYVQYLDSIVVSQDSQIAELKEQKVEQWESFNDLIRASDSTALAHQQLNNKLLEVERKANTKLRRQNRGLKIACVAIPVGIVAVVQALQ